MGREAAVTPMLGAILVLAVSVAGTAAALVLGAPVMQRMREQSALEGVVAQFEGARDTQHAMAVAGDGRAVDFSVPMGELELGRGTDWLLVAGTDAAHPGCDAQVLGWADGDADIHLVTGPACRPIVGDLVDACALADVALPPAEAGSACLEVARVDAAQETPVALLAAQAGRVTLAEPLSPSADYVLRLTDLQDEVYAEAWLLRGGRVHWESGRVAADLEAGAVLAHGHSSRVVAPVRVHAGPGPLDPVFLVLPLLATDGSAHSEARSQTLALALEASQVRHQGDVHRLRIDLAGGGAAAFCTHLQATGGGALPWHVDGPGGACGLSGALPTVPASDDDTVSLVYDPSGDAAWPLLVTHMRVVATLEP